MALRYSSVYVYIIYFMSRYVCIDESFSNTQTKKKKNLENRRFSSVPAVDYCAFYWIFRHIAIYIVYSTKPPLEYGGNEPFASTWIVNGRLDRVWRDRWSGMLFFFLILFVFFFSPYFFFNYVSIVSFEPDMNGLASICSPYYITMNVVQQSKILGPIWLIIKKILVQIGLDWIFGVWKKRANAAKTSQKN